MKHIDFLPETYHRRHQQRRAYAWEISVLMFFGALVAVAAVWQLSQRWQAGAQLAELQLPLASALETQAHYERLQAELATASQTAELYIYLEHPWPRTQLLAAIRNCLPESVSLTDLQVTSEATRNAAAVPLDEAAFAQLTPAERDLDRLRREADRRATVVWIAGATTDPASVYEFAHRLGQTAPLASVKLESVTNQGDKLLKRTEFRLRGELRPGYAQPAGPQADPQPEPRLAAQP